MIIASKIRTLLDKYFFVILILLVAASYGQILWMQPWQDDNALIFKLTHIEEAAGFLGKGVLGEGPYRYTATPYYLIYKLFGLNIPALFGLALIFYILATFSIYFLFKTLIDKSTGKLVSILFATNYVTSDSFIRLFNSISSSLGVMLLSSLLVTYWKYLQTKKVIWYFLAVLAFWLSTEFVFVRFHYLVALVISIEVIFFWFPLKFSLWIKSILRQLPFIAIFIWQYLINGDSRSGDSLKNIKLILTGKFENIFSIFTGIGQLVVPDKLLSSVPALISHVITNPYYQILTINGLLFLFFNILLFRFSKRGIFTKVIYFFISLSWLMVSRLLYLRLSPTTSLIVLLTGFLGGLSILGLFVLSCELKVKNKKLCLLFLLLSLVNILSYILYDPSLFYGVYNSRYLVHSFIGLVGVLSIIGVQFKSKIFLTFVLAWGAVNLFTNIINQQEIIYQRSLPIYNFHRQLKQSIGSLPKGSILYFDLQDNSTVKTRFSDAISSSQMPETAAIAWRFGLDRYDFKLTTDYDNLQEIVKNDHLIPENIYSFWYTKDGLFDTTSDLRKLLTDNAKKEVINANLPLWSKGQEDIVIDLQKPVSIIVPIELEFTINAQSVDPSALKYPFYRQGVDQLLVNYPTNSRATALKYGIYKEEIIRKSTFSASNQWEKRSIENAHNLDSKTVWQSNRVLWQKTPTTITIDIKDLININRLAWINGFADSTPTEYVIEGSQDNINWYELKKVVGGRRVGGGEMEVMKFTPQKVRFIKITYLKNIE